MTNVLRATLVGAAFMAAAASQALNLFYIGSGFVSGTTTKTGVLSQELSKPDFLFDTATFTYSATNPTSGSIVLNTNSATTPGVFTITFTSQSFESSSDGESYSGYGVLSGTYNGVAYSGTKIHFGGATDTDNFAGLTVTGKVDAVPEPASLAALSVGAIALIRRRKKA